MLGRVRHEYIRRQYGIHNYEGPVDFLEQYGRKIGKLLKGGEPDIAWGELSHRASEVREWVGVRDI